MNYRSRSLPAGLGVLFVLCTVFCATRPEVAEGSNTTTRTVTSDLAAGVQEAITLLAEKLNQIESLSLTWKLRHVNSLMGELGEGDILTEFTYQAPALFNLSVPGKEVFWHRDGALTQLWSPSRKLRYEATQASDLELNRLTMFLDLPPDIGALMRNNRSARLTNAARSQEWERLPDEPLNGRTHIVIHAKRSVPFLKSGKKSARLYFDTESGLLSRIVEEDSEIQGDPAEAVDGLLGETFLHIESDIHAINTALPSEALHSLPSLDTDEQSTNAYKVLGIRVAWDDPPDHLLGKAAPDFELKLLDGELFTLSAHRGHVVVIDFWATWCGPCVGALSDMRDLSMTFTDTNVVFVGVSRDGPGQEKAVMKMLKEKEITYSNGIDIQNLAAVYGVHGIPNVLVIDREGIIQSRQVGFGSSSAQDLEKEIRKCLAQE